MKDVDHPNIIKIYETYMDKFYFHFVIEFCDGGDLYEKLINKSKFNEKESAIIIEQVLSALNHCHYKNICHRDLKPENIVFAKKSKHPRELDLTNDEAVIKIIDFGLAKFISEGNSLKSKVGTPYYVAPEVLEGSYDYRCDNWSVGVITYTMLCGYPPFFGENH
jgi:calcium-dependent protein kinase